VTVKKKRELFLGLPPTSRGSVALPQTYPCPGPGILTWFPFDRVTKCILLFVRHRPPEWTATSLAFLPSLQTLVHFFFLSLSLLSFKKKKKEKKEKKQGKKEKEGGGNTSCL